MAGEMSVGSDRIKIESGGMDVLYLTTHPVNVCLADLGQSGAWSGGLNRKWAGRHRSGQGGGQAGWIPPLDSSLLGMSWPWVNIFYVCNITAKAVNVTLEILQDQSLPDNPSNVPQRGAIKAYL